MAKKRMHHNTAKAIQLTAQGLTSQQVADELGLKQASDVRKRLARPSVRQELLKEIVRQGGTLEKVVKPVIDALEAKESIVTKDGIEIGTKINHTVRMQASDRMAKWLGLDAPEADNSSKSGMSNEDIKQLASESDEIVLTQMLFKRVQG